MKITLLNQEQVDALLSESDQATSGETTSEVGNKPVTIQDQLKMKLEEQQLNETPQEKMPTSVEGLRSYFQENQGEEEPGLKKYAKDIGSLGVRAAQSIPNLIALPENIRQAMYGDVDPQTSIGKVIKNIAQPAMKLSEGIESIGREQLGLGESLDSPEYVNRIAQLTAGNLPILFLTGGAGLTKVAADLAGSAGIVAAEEMGLGPMGQILGSALGQAGFNKLANIAKQKPKVRVQLVQDLYKKEPKYGNKIKLNTQKILEPFEKAYEETVSKDPHLYSKMLKDHTFKSLNELENSKNLTASDLFSQKAQFNKIYKAIKDPSDIERSTMNRFNKIYNTTLEGIGKDNPTWWSYASSANNLTKLDAWQNNLLNTVKSSKELTKKVKDYVYPLGILGGSATAALGLPTVGKAAAVIGGVGVAGKYGFNKTLMLYNMMRTPEGRKVLTDVMVAGAKSSQPLLSKALNNLERYSKKFPEIKILSQEEADKLRNQ